MKCIRSAASSALALLVCGSLGVAACGQNPTTAGPEAFGAAASGGGTGTGGDGGGAAAGGDGKINVTDHGAVVSLVIDPSTATINVLNGVSTPQKFTLTATYEDQVEEVISGAWEFDRLDLALVQPGSGTVAAHGTLGGAGTLTATVGEISATAKVSVKLAVEDNAAGISAEDIAKFDTPSADPSGALVYPYDKTVFARDILAPELMWNGGGAGDVYRVRFSQDHLDATIYTEAAPPSSFLMSDDMWTQLAKSNAGEDVQVSVSRLSGGQAYAAMQQTWLIAQGSLRGTIYYWAVNQGRSMKISPGDTAPSPVFDSGPANQLGSPAAPNYDGSNPPWVAGNDGDRCVACHTVSKNGERLAGVFENFRGNVQTTDSPWGTIDLTAGPPSVMQISSFDTRAIYLALSPEGDFLVHNDMDFGVHLADAATGADIASALDGYTKTADPAFSPDGKLLAFSSNVEGAYPVEFWKADLDVVDFDASTQSFSSRRTILSGGGDALSFPSFAPDSASVFYQRGDYSRAKYGAGQKGAGNLYVTDVAGQTGQVPLDNANGVSYLEAHNQNLNYQPRANPIAVGGYYWVVFFSPRDYGNRMVSGGDPTYDNKKQLWVAAVNMDIKAGEDPSHPAFYLRGQDPATVNMEGYWTLDACLQQGDSCDAGYECCTGFCRPDGNGGFSCSPPGECAQIGELCETAADCCDADAQCIGGFCTGPPIR